MMDTTCTCGHGPLEHRPACTGTGAALPEYGIPPDEACLCTAYVPQDVMVAAMLAATTVEHLDGGRGRAIVAGDKLDESSPGWFMDYEWLEWFQSAHPEWSVEGMHDSPASDEIWRVSLERRPQH